MTHSFPRVGPRKDDLWLSTRTSHVIRRAHGAYFLILCSTLTTARLSYAVRRWMCRLLSPLRSSKNQGSCEATSVGCVEFRTPLYPYVVAGTKGIKEPGYFPFNSSQNSELYAWCLSCLLLCRHRTWMVHSASSRRRGKGTVILEYVCVRNTTIRKGNNLHGARASVLSAGTFEQKIFPMECEQAVDMTSYAAVRARDGDDLWHEDCRPPILYLQCFALIIIGRQSSPRVYTE